MFHTHRFAAFCELTAVTIEGKQLDHISRNVREVPFRRAQRVSLNRRYGESNQVVLHVNWFNVINYILANQVTIMKKTLYYRAGFPKLCRD